MIINKSKLPLLVTSKWLKAQISPCPVKLGSNLRILDTSWMPSKEVDGYRDYYQRGHIPTALHFDLKDITPEKRDCTAKYRLPDPNVFQDYVEELGISNSTHVIAYDSIDCKPSFRTWFLFRLFGHNKISVLDGGMHKWVSDGYAVTTEELEVERGKFTPDFQTKLLCDYKFMVKNIQSQSMQVVDSRGSKVFAGNEEDQSGGHIPNSINVPFYKLFSEDCTFKSKKELKALFKDAGVDVRKPMIATCQTAMTACSLAAAAHMLGNEDVPLYNGSFTEWNAIADSSNIKRMSLSNKKNE